MAKKRKKRVKVSTQKVIGHQKYINADTGEIINTTVVEKKVYSDINWHKVWIDDLMSILDLIGGKKLKILKYLLDNMRNYDNTISVTYKQIQDKLGVSSKTVAETMKILQETNFIKKLGQGYWMVNPDILIKGDGDKRQGLLVKYILEKDKNE